MTPEQSKEYIGRMAGLAPMSTAMLTFEQHLKMLSKIHDPGGMLAAKAAFVMARLLDEIEDADKKSARILRKENRGALSSTHVCLTCWCPVANGIEEFDDCKSL